MTWSNLRFNVCRSFVTMARNLPSCFSIQFLEQLLKFLVNFTLLKYVKSQRSYGFLITKELIFGVQILDLNDLGSIKLSYVQFLSESKSLLVSIIKWRISRQGYKHLTKSLYHFCIMITDFHFFFKSDCCLRL